VRVAENISSYEAYDRYEDVKASRLSQRGAFLSVAKAALKAADFAVTRLTLRVEGFRYETIQLFLYCGDETEQE
jgi:hypothetical protein